MGQRTPTEKKIMSEARLGKEGGIIEIQRDAHPEKKETDWGAGPCKKIYNMFGKNVQQTRRRKVP